MGIMDIKEVLRSLGLEAVRYKGLCLLIFILISSGILSMGYFWPETYASSAVLHVDETNIIEPLLRGRAEVSRVDRTNEAREIIYNRQFLEEVIANSGVFQAELAQGNLDKLIYNLRQNVEIISMGSEYFRVSHAAETPDESFQVLNSTVSLFINYTNKKKKEESYSAYQFIDSQVQSYKQKLEEAEDKLKDFKATNTDGTEAGVSNRIAELRSQIESLQLSRTESQSKISVLEKQISSEAGLLQTRSRLTQLETRRTTLSAELESLRLTYQDNYPDIISIKEQIEEIDKAVDEIYLREGVNPNAQSDESNNPLYEELRMQLSVAKVDFRTQSQRLESLNKLLSKELTRAEKVATNEAMLAELTRDYNVNRGVYEEMLERKENARLSMVLDIEGQGVSYQVHEPAIYPQISVGIQFIHFAVIAPILGFLIPFGGLIAYIILDPRVRSANVIRGAFDSTDFLVEVPYSYSMLSKRVLRRDVLLLILSFVVFMVVYGGFVADRMVEGGFQELLENSAPSASAGI